LCRSLRESLNLGFCQFAENPPYNCISLFVRQRCVDSGQFVLLSRNDVGDLSSEMKENRVPAARVLWLALLTLAIPAFAILVSLRWQQDSLSSDPGLSAQLFVTILLAATCGGLSVYSSKKLLPGVVCAGAFVFAAGLIFSMGATDDAYIFFRYVENTLRGLGPVFNVGEYVEGFSSPLWFLVLLILGKVGGIDLLPVLSVAAGIGAALFVFVAVGFSARVLGVSRLAGLASVLAAVWFPILFWTWSGMGTVLHLALLAWAVYFMYRGFQRPVADRGVFLLISTLLMTAATLTRPETGLLLGIHLLWCIALAPRSSVIWRAGLVAIPAVTFAVLEVVRFKYYGMFLPNTYYCKVGSPFELASHGLTYLASGVVPIASIAIPGFLALFRKTPGKRQSGYILTLVLAQIVVIIATGADYFIEMRFLTPFWVLLIPPAVLELEIGLENCKLLDRRVLRMAEAMGIVVAVFVSGFLYQSIGPHSVRMFGHNLVVRWMDFGQWANAETAPQTVIASPVIGAVGFYSRRPMIDMLGLTDPVISRSSRIRTGPKGHDRSNAQYVLGRSPDIIFLDGWWKDESSFLEGHHWIPAVERMKSCFPSAYYQFTNLRLRKSRWSIYVRTDKKGIAPCVKQAPGGQ